MSKSAVAINIQIGHTARVLTQSTEEGYTHEWSVCVQGQDNRSITQFVEKVVFILHESFKKPRRTLKNPPFKITERGYGGFNLPVEIYFRSNCEETRKTRFEYDLFLQEISGLPINHIRTERVTFFSPLEEFRKRLLDSGGEIVTSEAGLTSPSSVPSTTGSSNNSVASVGASGGASTTSGSGGGTSRGIRSSTTSSVSADSGSSSAKQSSNTSIPHKASTGKKTKSSGESGAFGAINSSAAAVKKVGVETRDLFVVVEEIEAVTDFNEVFRGGTWLEASAKLYLWAEDIKPSESSCREALRMLAEKHRYGTVSRYIATVAPMRIHEFSYEAILQTDHTSLKAIDDAKKILQAVREFFAAAKDAESSGGDQALLLPVDCNNNDVDSVTQMLAHTKLPGTDSKEYGSPKVMLEKLNISTLGFDSLPMKHTRPYGQEHRSTVSSTDAEFHSEKNSSEDYKTQYSNNRQSFETNSQSFIEKKSSTNGGGSCGKVEKDTRVKGESRPASLRQNKLSEKSPRKVPCESRVPVSANFALTQKHSECPILTSSQPTLGDVAPKLDCRMSCESIHASKSLTSLSSLGSQESRQSSEPKVKRERSLRPYTEQCRSKKRLPNSAIAVTKGRCVSPISDGSNGKSQAVTALSLVKTKRSSSADAKDAIKALFECNSSVLKGNESLKIEDSRKRRKISQQGNFLEKSTDLKKNDRSKERKIAANSFPSKKKSDANNVILKPKENISKKESLFVSVSEKNSCGEVSSLKNSTSDLSILLDGSDEGPSKKVFENCARSVKVEPPSGKTTNKGMEYIGDIATDAFISSVDACTRGSKAVISAPNAAIKLIKSDMEGGASRVAEASRIKSVEGSSTIVHP
ncbi:YEATS protein [Trinorchestia longiramus]|nr:YEATS protein [Trinorchestia longiramus]